MTEDKSYTAFVLTDEYMDDPSSILAVIFAKDVEQAALLTGGVPGSRVKERWEVRYSRNLFQEPSSEEDKKLISPAEEGWMVYRHGPVVMLLAPEDDYSCAYLQESPLILGPDIHVLVIGTRRGSK